MSKSTIILLSILGVLTVSASLYFGYMYLQELEGNKQNNVVNNQEADQSNNTDGISQLDSEINNVVNSIESDNSEVDFEDFDSELEFGL